VNILVLNSGSSTLKFSVHDTATAGTLDSGTVECSDCGAAFQDVLRQLGTGSAPDAIGHRVVHGGPDFTGPARLDANTIATIERCSSLAPLHNEPALAVIRASIARFPAIPQVAVFDTAFHRNMPQEASRYAIPERWFRDHQVHRYGFHGISHASVAGQAAVCLGRRPQSLRIISLHLGNGASAAAIDGGRSIDTSMGLTPLEGLVMGTRSGDLDIAAALYAARREGLTPAQLEHALTRESGLQGLCGDSDMRVILARCEQGDSRARLALSIYCYRIRKYIGAYFAALGGLDALVFTGGVGENAAPVRAGACEGLEALGIAIDCQKNALPSGDQPRAIHAEGAAVAILVVPSREDLEIARQTAEFLGQR
tara:strand:- start:19661 stop:20767 length:1107 start_codon:yes stop_codon:yes gene_type:complete